MKMLKILLAAMLVTFLVETKSFGQGYEIETWVTNKTLRFQVLSTNKVVVHGPQAIPFLVTCDKGDTYATTNIIGITIWDGTNKVAEYIGPLTKVGTYQFLEDLKRRDYGDIVFDLQTFFNLDPRTLLGLTGPGSPGMETMTFGGRTEASLTNYEAIHNLFLDDGSLSLVFDEKDRNYVNALEVPKDYIIAWVPFIANVPIEAESTKDLQIVIQTVPGWKGTFSLGLADPTDHYWNATNMLGADVTQDFNSTRGSKITVPQLAPELSIHKNYIQILGKPGSAMLWVSTDMYIWRIEKVTIPAEGIAFYPFVPDEKANFFKVSQF